MQAAHPFMSNTLTEVGIVCRARAVILWACAEECLDLVCDWRLSQSLFNLMHLHWADAAVELREGRRVELPDEQVVLIPLMGRQHRLVGVLQYAGRPPESDWRRDLLAEAMATLTTSLEDGPPAVDPEAFTVALAHIERHGGVEELERRFYSRLLRRHGWNVALLAKVLGLARQTLHNRLKALGLERLASSPKARPRRT